LRELYTQEEISGFTTEVILDAVEYWADQVLDVWCLEFKRASTRSFDDWCLEFHSFRAHTRSYVVGLVLVSLPDPDCYRRIGIFELKLKEERTSVG
jgi:hypothetical protein